MDFDLIFFEVFVAEGFGAEWFGRLQLKLGENDQIWVQMIK